MVQITSGVLGAVAATLAFGAVHLEVAAGNDFLGPRGLVAAQDTFQDASQGVGANAVNRAAKTDRGDVPAGSRSVTVSFGLANVPATSIVMRVPVKDMAFRDMSPKEMSPEPTSQPTDATPDTQAKNTSRAARAVACEPSVSLLVPVARQLQASRCVT